MSQDKDQPTDKTPAEIVDRVWELAEKIDFCMFDTWNGERQEARPLSSRVYRDEHAIYFLVNAGSAKTWQIEDYPKVNLGYADVGAMKFISISGTAEVSNDRALIKKLWSDFDKAWWKDENDPEIRVITVRPETAELWDSPGKLISFTTMLVSAVTGKQMDHGDNATVRM